MKLPDFLLNTQMDNLRRKMAIPEGQYGSFQPSPSLVRNPSETPTTTIIEINEIAGPGKEVAYEELTILEDGTFAYKDLRVLLYIRDTHVYSDTFKEPRYHLKSCQTIHEMRERGRMQKYVISNKIDGVFTVNIIRKHKKMQGNRELRVCQNCLNEIAFEGFTYRLDRQKRLELVEQFAPKRFFELYPVSLHRTVPSYNWENSPLDIYTSDFPKISRELRERAGWKCEDCRGDFSPPALRRFLHTHHIGLQT